MRNTKYEYIEYLEDDERWYGAIKKGWKTDEDTVSVFADTKKELLDAQKYFVKE